MRWVLPCRYRVTLGRIAGWCVAFCVFSTAGWGGPPGAEKPPAAGKGEAAREAREPLAECRWAASSLVIDGKADEADWKQAQVIENFGEPWLAQPLPLRGTTRARLLWDRDYLYFFAEMRDVDLFANLREHDGALWNNDAFELFFQPDAQKPGYFEFEVNAANAVLDAFYPVRDMRQMVENFKVGEFRVESRVVLHGTLNQRDDEDRGWDVEGRIPWADFLRAGGRPLPGEEWKFSLCRCNFDRHQRSEFTTISPHVKKTFGAFFHQHEDYPLLKFLGPATSAGLAHGLAKRQPMTTSTVIGSPDPALPYRAKRMYPGYAPQYPILAKPFPGTDQLLVVSEDKPWGHSILSRIRDLETVTTADAVPLLSTPDHGLVYDACFHPQFAKNHYLYLGWNGDYKQGRVKKRSCRITRYTVNLGPPLTIDAASAKTILEWESDGHNGLAMCFDKDGLMYITSGDGSSDSDTDETGQTTNTYLSKVLRIDVDHPTEQRPYSIPADNPFVGDSRFVPETWAYGLRNPWRITTDARTGHLWVGNNGQDRWEQAYLIRKGANYGWSVYEGSHPFYLHRTTGPTPVSPPTLEHPHSEFRSLTGGIVPYGSPLPELDGVYLYGDYSTGRIWGMRHDGTKPLWHKELASPRLQITNFAQNSRGELLICDHSPAGGLYTLERMPPMTKTVPFPRKLSESGLFVSVAEHRMQPGVIPYSVNAPFWSDGMYKERFFSLPGTETISMTNNRGWNFPDKTVLIKSFAVEREAGNPASRQWIETRFLTRQEGEWYGYSYRWNAAGTDADLVVAQGQDETFEIKTTAGTIRQAWHYPSRAECMMCHSRAANFVLGLSTLQMNKTHDYAQGRDNQLLALEHAGILGGFDWAAHAREELSRRSRRQAGKRLEKPYLHVNGQQEGQRQPPPSTLLPTSVAALPRLVDPYDPHQDLTLRARAWLHSNCSTCHVPAGGGNAQMELDFDTSLAGMKIIDTKPTHNALGIPDARLVAPGDPQRSVLLKRAGLRGPNQMPPLATSRTDDKGLELLRQWILSLPTEKRNAPVNNRRAAPEAKAPR